MDIGYAVQVLRSGGRVGRDAWRGRGVYIFMWENGGTLRHHTKPFIMMKDADGMLVPWVPSHDDVLAIDYRSMTIGVDMTEGK